MANNIDTEQGWNLFGFQIKKKDSLQPSFVPKSDDDGGSQIDSYGSGAAYNSYAIDLDPSAVKNEVELIKKYREISLVSDIDIAVDEIINEVIIYDEQKPSVTIDFTEKFSKQYSADTREIILEEFDNILGMLNFSTQGNDIIRNYYVDGRLAYHKIIDDKRSKLGIQELRQIDSAKLKKVTEIKKEKDQRTGIDMITGQEEYYIFSDKGFVGNEKMGLKISKDSIAYVSSGIIDKNTGLVLSYLHKAIRPLNQLRMMEDAEVIYRWVRAPERRVFYVDISGMTKTKGEQYLKDVMARFKNKQVFDAATGTVKDDKKHLSMLEDFWLPRANGGKSTEITTLPGGQGLGSIENVGYFRNILYQALNIPLSRLQQGQGQFNLGRENEISRDEIKFKKFISKIRKKFNTFFLDILRTQLILKGITSSEDWEVIKNEILFNYIEDNFFSELKESEMLRERMQTVQLLDPYVGKYIDKRFIQRDVMKLTDKQIDDMVEGNAEDQEVQQKLAQDILAQYGIDPNNPQQEKQ